METRIQRIKYLLENHRYFLGIAPDAFKMKIRYEMETLQFELYALQLEEEEK